MAQTLEAHAAELRASAKLATSLARPVITGAADQVLDDWKQAYSTIRSKKNIASSLGRWITAGQGWVMAEVGVRKGVASRRQGGSFAHIIEFGSVNNPPRNDGGEALLRAEPGFHAGMLALARALFAGVSGGGMVEGISVQTARLTPARFNTGYGQVAG